MGGEREEASEQVAGGSAFIDKGRGRVSDRGRGHRAIAGGRMSARRGG